jgi:creatinine amidohydrolase/Fe(II)-dependent formamide hydrolase-like protein
MVGAASAIAPTAAERTTSRLGETMTHFPPIAIGRYEEHADTLVSYMKKHFISGCQG